ncbi:MAG: FAD-dependent oxidoreductase [Bacteroidota bacterium]
MAKTKGFLQFKKALQKARLTHQYPHFALEENAINFSTPKALSKRTALKVMGVLGASTFASSCQKEEDVFPNPATSPTIAIVGGGLAGLTAAYYLKKAGMTATVYEAANRFGGRAFKSEFRRIYPIIISIIYHTKFFYETSISSTSLCNSKLHHSSSKYLVRK